MYLLEPSSTTQSTLFSIPKRTSYLHVESDDRDPEFYNLSEAVMLKGPRVILPPKKDTERKCIDKKDCRKFCT